MTDPVAALATDAQQSVIAAHRYLAFIHCEHRFLLHELYPGIEKGDVFSVPVDTAVSQMMSGVSPIDRAPKVLRFLDVEPYHYDVWVDFLGVDMSKIPIIGTAGDDKNPGKVDWGKLRKWQG